MIEFLANIVVFIFSLHKIGKEPQVTTYNKILKSSNFALSHTNETIHLKLAKLFQKEKVNITKFERLFLFNIFRVYIIT
jgi:uncharacterized membrane-anchored protein YitT (DUF2179 family)